MMREEPQMEMFCHPPRHSRPEKGAFYDAVLFLRRAGLTVVRVSNVQSAVDGTLMDNRKLRRMAAQMGWEP